jgi:mRNA interferase HigB
MSLLKIPKVAPEIHEISAVGYNLASSSANAELLMHIVTRKHLVQATARHPDAAKEIRSWYEKAKSTRWRNILEAQQDFPDADAVDGYVVFNLRHNRYRLIVVMHYSRIKDGRLTEGHLYIRSFLTHQEYDNKSNWNRGSYR